MSTKTRILSHEEIQHKVRRIAYQIYESNMNENPVSYTHLRAHET